MTALFGKLLIWSLAAVGLIVIAVAAWLWLSARPILEQAQSQYQALPSSVQCAGAFQPPHYPSGARELESEVSADRSVYAAACNAADMRRECAYLSGAPRWLGFRAYLGLYLSSCEVRALSLHGETHLGRAMVDIYPGRDPATLTEFEQSCLVARTRYGQSSRQMFCERNPQCCAAVALDADAGGESH